VPDRQRILACHYCRRIWRHYSINWADELFASDDASPGGYVHPSDWRNPVMRDTARIAEDYGRGRATAEELATAHAKVKAFAEKMQDDWSWANHRLGDSASGAEYEVGAVTFYTASACAAASESQVDLAGCGDHAAHAIGFRWDEAQKTNAVGEERRRQCRIRRRFLRWRSEA
jgi:hypothetical protein